MSRALFSAAMTEEVDSAARKHLLRADRQEDLCFALWHPSRGKRRTTALIRKLVLPHQNERVVHGNVSFLPSFFERALEEASRERAGLALMHSHPGGRGWQGMSRDDVRAEQGNAGAVFGATGMPFVGLTLAGNGAWSARFWHRRAPRVYERDDCATVRVVGNALRVTYCDRLAPPPKSTEKQVRTVSAWGSETQADLARLHTGIVGAGSVGGFIGEAIARTGFEDVSAIDFDTIEVHNLDRLIFATAENVGEPKVPVLSRHLSECSTAAYFSCDEVLAAVFEEDGYRAALDCDVLYSCVDRPWGRHVLNFIAYAHLIPVIDGGIAIRTNRFGKLVAADWRAHTATPGRPCLQCLRQYDSGLVQTEREGNLDDPMYIAALPKDHPLKTRENVCVFSMACASLQMLQMLALTVSPLGQSNPGAQLYHFVGGFMEDNSGVKACHPDCAFPSLAALGDESGIDVTGARPRKRS
jgi:molybdopterin/thiamine biosynthesis adenylyltransferase